MSTLLYGIHNCDTVKKARKWLEAQGIDYQFHDLRQDGLTTVMLKAWVAQLGWEPLLNRRSTSWRQLAEVDKVDLDQHKGIALMLQQPTLIKRPVLSVDDHLTVGFNASTYHDLFAQASEK